MRTEKEIIEKRKECYSIALDKRQDKNEESEGDYYSGAWHALRWVMEDLEDI